MKVSIQTLAAPAPLAEKSTLAVLMELTKARLTALVVLTTLVGFYIGAPGPMEYPLLLNTLLGTALVACGASALNQWMEREYDARMRRTEDRPLPSGRMQPETVLLLGMVASLAGLAYLVAGVNLITALLGAVTLVWYLFIYTPLKRVTTLNTLMGAIPGALPPLMGWTAASGELSAAGWSLFGILFFWQLPHFLAIAWLYREDYARAGFVMLPLLDPSGERTARQAVSHTLGLLPISLCPFLFHLAGLIYLGGALILGGIFLGAALRFSGRLTQESARLMFLISIIYLPALLGVMVIDKLK